MNLIKFVVLKVEDYLLNSLSKYMLIYKRNSTSCFFAYRFCLVVKLRKLFK